MLYYFVRQIATNLLVLGALSGCGRASYSFKPNMPAYHNTDILVPSAAALPVAPATPVAIAPAATKTVLPGSASTGRQQQLKIKNLIKLPLVRRVIIEKVLSLATKKLMVRRNEAEVAQLKLLSKRVLLQVGGVLAAIGLILFLAALSTYGFDAAITLAAIAVISFTVGLVLLIVGIFQKS